MARTREEIAFSEAVGRICEKEIAPLVLRPLCDPGTVPYDLNEVEKNHRWADWAIWWNHRLTIFAVRGRIRWQKPQRSHFLTIGFKPSPNTAFGRQGERLRQQAVESVRRWQKLPDGELIQSMWLSIPVYIDSTYDAYWGPATEMRVMRRSTTKEPGLAIPMAESDLDRYTRENRRLAFRVTHAFPWHMNGHWACNAHEHWLRLNCIPNRDERIVAAIQAAAVEIIDSPGLTDRSECQALRGISENRHQDVRPEPNRSDSKSVRIAARISQGDLPRERLCLLRVLASDSARWWSMRDIAKAMQAQKAENGKFYRSDRYNESAKALYEKGLVQRSERGRELLRQITDAGLNLLQSSGREYA
jgi:hypothetical protein